jgi:thioredoxin 1
MSKLKEITISNFEAEVLRSPVPVAVDFYGEQCGPCRILKPILESLAEAIGDRAKIVAVDVAENERLVIDHGIQAIPTIIVYKNGHETRRMMGLAELSELRVALGA